MITLLQESSNINEQQIMSYSVKLFDELSEDINSKLDTLLQKYPNRYMSIVLPCFAKVMNTLDKNIYEKKSSALNVTYYAEPDVNAKTGGPCWFYLDASSYVDVEEFYNYLWDKYGKEYFDKVLDDMRALDSQLTDFDKAHELAADYYDRVGNANYSEDWYGESYMREERYYDLAPQKRDTRKSFYGKAKVIDKGNGEYELISYNTPVACVKDGKVVYADLRKYSATTDRHIREFLAQYCDECNESYKRESTEEIEPGNIYDIAVKTLPKEDIDHHASDLYLRKTPESTALINKMKYRNSGLLSTFRDNIDGDIWYELPFCYGFERSAAEREAELDRSVKQLKSIYGKESKRAVKREASSYRSYTKKQIKDYVTDGLAIDVTNYGFGQMNELLKSIDKEIVGVSHGTYGVNAVLFKDSKTGQLYAVCARNTASQMVI